MRDIVIAANWKMNKTFQEAEDFLVDIFEYLHQKDLEKTQLIICPSYPYLEMATDLAVESSLSVGAQNVNEHEKGAYTGEISAAMLHSLDVDYCIIGHSERRKYYAEKDKVINQKLKILQQYNIVPIVCIGESLKQREEGKEKKIITHQLQGVLKDIDINNNLILAYEPIWAIGTGKTASPEQAQEIHILIRKWVKDNFNENIAESLPILYGGSVKPENIKELLQQKDIDGGLIGSAALDSGKLKKMIDIAEKI
ncbi:MAG: triose-phosphate isomerase [Candidatus Cloacimonadota bacterium]|nr:triose-phosphate isomerase [Candidatus Cloacimonadota bacterium]